MVMIFLRFRHIRGPCAELFSLDISSQNKDSVFEVYFLRFFSNRDNTRWCFKCTDKKGKYYTASTIDRIHGATMFLWRHAQGENPKCWDNFKQHIWYPVTQQ